MIYLAAPLFNEFERARNANLCEQIERHVRVFLPQRDGTLLTESVRDGMRVEEAEKVVFLNDLSAIDGSSVVVAILDGAVIDEGVSFELGYAYSRSIECVGIQTDSRRQLPTGNNPMISQSLSRVFSKESDFFTWLSAREFGDEIGPRHGFVPSAHCTID